MPSKDSDQSAYIRSLIRVITGHSVGSQRIFKRTAKTQISLCGRMHRLIRIFAGLTCSIVGNAVPTHIEMDISHKKKGARVVFFTRHTFLTQLTLLPSIIKIYPGVWSVERNTRRRSNYRKMGGRIVHPLAETFRGLVLSCLPFDSNGLVSLEARSSVGPLSHLSQSSSPPPPPRVPIPFSLDMTEILLTWTGG